MLSLWLCLSFPLYSFCLSPNSPPSFLSCATITMSDRPRANRDKQAQLQHRDNKAKRATGSGQEGGRRGTQRGQQGATLTAIKTIVVCLLLVNFIHYCLYCHFPRAGLPYPALSLLLPLPPALCPLFYLLSHKENSIKTQQYRTPSSKLQPRPAPGAAPVPAALPVPAAAAPGASVLLISGSL